MSRGDTYELVIPGGIGLHYAVVIQEPKGWAIVIYGQTEEHPGAYPITPNDPVASEFGGRIVRKTHFHRNNIAAIPISQLPAGRLGHVDDTLLPDFIKAAKPGLIEFKKITDQLRASGNQCECQGGCSRHAGRCATVAVAAPPVGRALMEWRLTVRGTVVCRACFSL